MLKHRGYSISAHKLTLKNLKITCLANFCCTFKKCGFVLKQWHLVWIPYMVPISRITESGSISFMKNMKQSNDLQSDWSTGILRRMVFELSTE